MRPAWPPHAALDDILAPSYAGHFGSTPQMDRTAFQQFVGRSSPRSPTSTMPWGIYSFTPINTMHLRDGKIVEHWSEFDGIGMMQQLGAMPTPA